MFNPKTNEKGSIALAKNLTDSVHSLFILASWILNVIINTVNAIQSIAPIPFSMEHRC